MYENQGKVEFVRANVDGILAGMPVWKSSQHRVLAPLGVALLRRVSATPAQALTWFMGLGLLAEKRPAVGLAARDHS